MSDEPTILPPTVRAAGDPRPKPATWTMLGVDTRDGACSQCARKHQPHEPHDQRSLAYQYSFYAEHDRWPTWADAMAHCDEDMRAAWTEALHEYGVEL